MDDTTWDALERLKHLDHESRRSLVHELYRSDQINANGFTLYQYHVVPAIMGAQEALHPDAVSLHYAQIRTGLRWSYLDEEQSRFWERQTISLFEGRLAPLQFETYSSYVLGDYDCLDLEPQECCPSETSTKGDEVNLDNVETSIPDVAECTRDAISPDLQTESDSPSTPTPSLPVCEKVESISPRLEPSTPSKENNPADVPELSAKSDIQDVLDQLQSLPVHDSKRQNYYAELCTLLTADGFTLFRRHVEASIARDGLPPSLAVHSLPELWRDLPDQERNDWERRTGIAKKAFQKEGKKRRRALFHLCTDLSNNKSRRYRAWADASLTILEDVQKASEDSQKPLEDIHSAAPLDPTSIIDVLVGCSTIDLDIEEVIARVLHSVATRCKTDPNLQLRFRWRGFRIDYSPKSIGFITLRERLRACMRPPGPSLHELQTACSDRQAALNDLVKPLVHCNRASPAFSDMDQVGLTEKEMEDCHVGYESSLYWVERILLPMRPFDPKNKEAIVEAVIKQLRWRATKSISEPYSNRQSKTMMDTYKLTAKLLHCFVCDNLSDPTYHDLLEQAMHGFWKVEPELAEKVKEQIMRRKK